MTFKIEKSIPIQKFYKKFTNTLDVLEVGDSIGGLTKKEMYSFRGNFYTKHFVDRKFTFRKESEYSYRLWRIK
jgi:hypothetical protein